MRRVFVKGENGFSLDLGCSVDRVCAVLEHPKAKFIDPITAEVELTGKELSEFLTENFVLQKGELDGIKEEETYVLHGWDW